ncbi:uncharacterized protein LOC121939388, partial [Plectropomus leopardus]|uniref:uncharacterized protein LOC121939388 n=1 Tax=Plectropomus leopardus TaxID=160734 RepID=UPI001C4BA7BC
MIKLSQYTLSNHLFKSFLSLLQVCSFTVSCPVSIGKLVQIELDKQSLFTPENWLPNKVEVKSPEGDLYKFPIYSWITDSQMQSFREGQEPKKQPLRNPDSGPSFPEGNIYGPQINLEKSDSKVPGLIEGTDTGFPAPEGVTFNVPGYRQIGAPQEEKDIGLPAPEVYTLDFNSDPQNGTPQEGTEPDKKPFQGPDIGFSSPAGDTFKFTIYCGNTDSTGPRVREGKGLWKLACLTC